MFHTPPIKSTFTTQTTKELEESSLLPNEDADQEEPVSTLPDQLSSLVSQFLKELKTPKHQRPITGFELSQLFQQFYQSFHNKADVFVNGSIHKTKEELLTKEQQDLKAKEVARRQRRVRGYVELAEKEATEAIFDRLFNKFEQDRKVNEYINNKIRALQKVQGLDYNEFLEIDGVVELDTMLFGSLSNKFDQWNYSKCPREKLDTLLDVHSSLNKLLKDFKLSNNGDLVLPLLIYLIVIHQSSTDFYLQLLFIKRFRNSEYLTGEYHYCLINLEAALTYLQSLVISQPSLDLSQLSNNEYLLLSQPAANPKDKEHETGIKSLGSALDSSLKTMMNRFAPDEYNPLRGIAGVMKWPGSSTPTPTPTNGPTDEGARGKHRQKPLVDLDRFKGRDFTSLTVRELEQMWQDYRLLVEHELAATRL